MGTNSIFKFYSPYRPVSIGTYPKDESVEIFNFDTKTPIPELNNKSVWGYVTYTRNLTDTEVENYELIPSPSNPIKGD